MDKMGILHKIQYSSLSKVLIGKIMAVLNRIVLTSSIGGCYD